MPVRVDCLATATDLSGLSQDISGNRLPTLRQPLNLNDLNEICHEGDEMPLSCSVYLARASTPNPLIRLVGLGELVCYLLVTLKSHAEDFD
ncbi:hypothetical protein J6590_037464 [Homalodisca vitripennis]|nr:hypothetical protein J6590_037464 [Homalodisca vitripennis]